jgi:membrane protease subunit HflK
MENNPWGDQKLNIKLPKLKFNISGIVILIIVLVVWLLSGFYIVKANEQAVVVRFGKIVKVVGAGPHFHIPFPVERIDKAEVTKIHRIEIGFRTSKNGQITSVPKEALMLTGDENIVSIDLIVQYKIGDIVKYLYNVLNVEKTIKDAAESAIREVAGKEKIDDILTTEKNRIQIETQDILQEILNFYNSGIDIVAVQLQDVEPPKAVVAAFKDVASAKEDKNRFINEAEAYRNEIIPKARAEAAAMILDAEAYEVEKIERAKGETVRFLNIYESYKKAPEITKKRLYLEKMAEVLRDNQIFIFDENIKNVNPFMGFEEIKGKGGEK